MASVINDGFISIMCYGSNGRPRMGHLGQIPPSPCEEPAILVIKILNFMSGQDLFNYTTHENMHILLVLITISPETEANQCKTVTQHLRAY